MPPDQLPGLRCVHARECNERRRKRARGGCRDVGCNGAYGGVLAEGLVKLGVVDVAVAVLGTARKGALP